MDIYIHIYIGFAHLTIWHMHLSGVFLAYLGSVMSVPCMTKYCDVLTQPQHIGKNYQKTTIHMMSYSKCSNDPLAARPTNNAIAGCDWPRCRRRWPEWERAQLASLYTFTKSYLNCSCSITFVQIRQSRWVASASSPNIFHLLIITTSVITWLSIITLLFLRYWCNHS